MKRKKRSKAGLKHKYFWLTLSLLVVIPIIVLISLTPSTSLSGRVVQNIVFVKEGGAVQVGGGTVKGLRMVEITLKDAVEKAQLKIEEDKTIPFEGVVYSKFKVYSEDKILEPKVSQAKLFLSLDKNSMGSLYEKDVRLYYQGNELVTTEVFQASVQKDYLNYEATSEGIGEFVIGKKIEVKKVEAAAVESKPAEESVAPAVEQKAPVLEQPATLPLAGEASGQGEAKEGLFSRIGNFFKGLFK